MKKQAVSIVKSALAYLSRGLFVVPIPPGLNHPTLANWQKLRVTKSGIKKYFVGAVNIGLLLKPSKLMDVDLDCPEALAAASVLLSDTKMVSGRPGNPASHRFYRAIGNLENRSFVDPRNAADGQRRTLIEIRTNGQTVVPPSRHSKSNELIEWASFVLPAEIDSADLEREVAKVAAAALLARYWPTGSRHFAALALAGMLSRSGWSKDAAKQFFSAVCDAAHDEESSSRVQDVLSTWDRLAEGETVTGGPTLAELVGEDIVNAVREWLELRSVIDSLARNSDMHPTDLGNARRLVARHGKDVRYCFSSGKWLVWCGSRWIADDTGAVERMAKETVRTIYKEVAETAEGGTRWALAKHALKSEAESRIRAMVNLAKTEPTIPVRPSELDANPWLLNCRNGIVDLRTGELLPHSPSYFCTKQVPVDFLPNAACPKWFGFLDRITAGNAPLTDFLQRALGYSLTGVTSEQVLFVLHGTGANGKSTFIETVRNLLGDYAQQADFNSFLEKRNDGARNDLARLRGARFVAAVEAGDGKRLAETVVKQVTGGDTITARFLYHEYFEYLPQFKLFLASNHKPRIAGTDEAIWRRIRLIPFAVTIPAEQRDRRLLEKLTAELPGILAWAVRGCLEWQRCGLDAPLEVTAATSAYRDEMDVFGQFLEEKCTAHSEAWVTSTEIYARYKSWCDQRGEYCWPTTKLGTKLAERGFTQCKRHGRRGWLGVDLKFGSSSDESDVDSGGIEEVLEEA